ncbi:putative MICOS complex subunit MIC60 [Iris pallida]|uniref:MICOS complex subunit MIC60 n=1 Tax=Iris pallida TaxID=29817 RepID=A0AAX6GIG6_IRIPA|nr:putative MICOS complex subunit MIC60 [Iris pallida]
MGCSASKLENEDTVRRCKERRRLMKEAVQCRLHLASAHSGYLRSLLSAASSLSRFSLGATSLSVSSQTPPIVLLPPAASDEPSPRPPQQLSTTTQNEPLHQQQQQQQSSPLTTKIPPPLPPPTKYFHNSATYAHTPSHASSSAWDWENFYPPSPPDSDYFDRLEKERRGEQQPNTPPPPPPPHHHITEENEEEEEEEDEEEEEGEVHCQEWDRHCSSSSGTATSSTDGDHLEEEEEGDEIRSRSDAFAARSDFGGGYPPPSESGFGSQYSFRGPPAPPGAPRSESGFGSECSFGRPPRPPVAARSEAGSSSSAGGEMRIVVRHRDLTEITASLEEYFAKAAAAGRPVSEFLETGRDQLDRSVRQLKKTVYHSNSVLSALSSTWSSKPPLVIKYRLDTGALESGGGKSHGSTLEQLLAWEKKLYEEVKAREIVKIEHEKKLSALQSLEYRGKDDAKIDKTKASVQKLQSLIVVTSQAVSTTSIAITKVRDNELAPQLVDMCYSLLTMWRSINQFHEVQNHIVQQVRGLVISTAGDPTSDLHRLATRDLEAAVAGWHSSFNCLIKYQREYIQALYGWLKLTLIHVGNDVNHHKSTHLPYLSSSLPSAMSGSKLWTVSPTPWHLRP